MVFRTRRDHGPAHALDERGKQTRGVVGDGEGLVVLRRAHQQAVGVFAVEDLCVGRGVVVDRVDHILERIGGHITVKVTPLISKEPLVTLESAATSSMT